MLVGVEQLLVAAKVGSNAPLGKAYDAARKIELVQDADQIVYAGASLHAALSEEGQRAFLDVLQRGGSVDLYMLDPKSAALPRIAARFGQQPRELLLEIDCTWARATGFARGHGSERFRLHLMDDVGNAGVYLYDVGSLKDDTGTIRPAGAARVLLVPHRQGVDPSKVSNGRLLDDETLTPADHQTVAIAARKLLSALDDVSWRVGL